MIIGEYSPRRSRGEYLPIITEPEANNCFSINIMGDKLLLNLGAKFQRSHVKLQNCHGNISCISIRAKMASRFKTVTIEEVTKLKEAAENLNT